MAKKEVAVEMTQVKKCKSCVRFGNDQEDGASVATSIYLQNDAFKALGEPTKIKVSVSLP